MDKEHQNETISSNVVTENTIPTPSITEPTQKKKGCSCLWVFIGFLAFIGIMGGVIEGQTKKGAKREVVTEEKPYDAPPLKQTQQTSTVESNKRSSKQKKKVAAQETIFSVMTYKNVSSEKLIQLLGKPDKITEGTCTGVFKIPCIVYTYTTPEMGSVDFTLVNNCVVRFHSLHKYPLTNKRHILRDLGIQREDTCRVIADTDSALRYRTPVKGIDDVWISLIDGDTFNSLQVTYDLSYYEEWFLELTIDEKVKYETDAKARVKSILAFPQTAVFPWTDWSYGKNLFYIVIASHVDYKNAYGGEIRTNFAIAYSRLTGEVVRLVFGDEVVDNGYVPTEKLIMELVNKGREAHQKK